MKVYVVTVEIPGCLAKTVEYPLAGSAEEAVTKVVERYPAAKLVSVEPQ